MTSLHQNIKKLSQSPDGLRLSVLKPNSRQIAERMIANGELIKVGNVYKWHDMESGK